MATPGLTGGLVAVGAVVVIALLLRASSGSRKDEGSVPTTPAPPPEREPEPGSLHFLAPSVPRDDVVDEDEDGIDDRLVVAVSSDGRAFVPDLHVVRVLPPPEQGEEWKVGSRPRQVASMNPGWSWSAGDLRGARIVRGDFDAGPWVLEALGRDGEYLTFAFETADAAEAAKQSFERVGVVQLGRDEDGRPMPPSAEQFEEARRIYEQTVAQLDLPDEDEGGPQEGSS